MTRSVWISILLFVYCVAFAGVTFAADRTVCFRMKIRDDRWNCSTSAEDGAQRPCNAGGYVWMVGHQVELWDKDWSGSDEYIGTWYIGGSGTQCMTFPWEGQSYHKGEGNPDLYLKYINKVNRTGYSNYIYVVGKLQNGNAANKTSWRNGSGGDENRYVAMNCTAGSTCSIYPSGSLVPTNDIASDRGLRIMALDSAQHALQAFGEVMDTHVKLRFPGRADCTTSCTTDRDLVHIASTRGNNGFNVAHEMGHTIQMQEFNQDWLRDDCSRNGDGHSMTSIEHESCATTEGFADYVGITAWYNPNNTSTVPIGWGWDLEAAQPQSADCSTNAHMEMQVAKAFWDLDDWNQSDGVAPAAGDDDDLAYSTTAIAKGWRQFPNGSANRRDGESGQDGVNMRDYYSNNTGRFTSANFFETFIEHNCLQAQVND